MVAAGSITVAVRVRPPTAAEAARLPEPCYESSFRAEGALSTPGRSVANTATLRNIVQIVDDRILTFDPDEKDRARAFVERGFMPPGSKRYKDRRFMFDKVFDYQALQQDVYDATAKPLLQGVLDGYNATVFAYGATGCGKTHTISGTDDNPGIIYLTMADLFRRIDERKDEWNVEVNVTFLEIYNEEIRDLLAEPGAHVPRGGLSIREDKNVKVVGLTELKPRSAEEVKEIVMQGNLRRTQSPTHANETSSRSHAVLQVHVTQCSRTASLSEQKTIATLSIIDLAGSERAAATTNMGQRMVEGANINKSLLALGNCINALCESGGAVRHVPYRNSKLTRLLKFSLGGNCKTVMIVCVAPTSMHFDDTHNTLVYAERATKIKTKVVTRNVVNVDRHVGRYVEAINALNIEVAELKAKLAGKLSTENDAVRRRKAETAAEVERAKADLATKTEHMNSVAVDIATCDGKLAIAAMKLTAIRARIADIDAMDRDSLSTDLEAERAILASLAKPEEDVMKPDSALNAGLRRTANSASMFEATIRAACERKSDRLDELSTDYVKLRAQYRKAEVELLRAKEERRVMKDAVEDMSKIMVGLVGMLGRCTVVVGQAAKTLSQPPDDEDAPTIMRKMSTLLASVKEHNDDAFLKLVGYTSSAYSAAVVDTRPPSQFQGYNPSWGRRISSGPAVLQKSTSARASRISSSRDPGGRTSPCKPIRSPRRSLRSSSAHQPYRKVSDKEKKGLKAPKSVQWKDEAGQGALDDGGVPPPVSVAILPASPTVVVEDASTDPTRCTSSLAGSESEWEDDNDRTDDSVTFISPLPPPRAPVENTGAGRLYGSLGRRPRASRLDPSFLKAKGRVATLGSLAEDDETDSSPRRVSHPLATRSLNQLPSSDDSGCGSDNTVKEEAASPRRMTSSVRLHMSTGKRRRSNMGLHRLDKARRRSSLIPQPSPPVIDANKPRRVLIGSPAKKKRTSLSKGAPRLKPFPIAAAAPSLQTGDMTVADLSFSKGSSRPWR